MTKKEQLEINEKVDEIYNLDMHERAGKWGCTNELTWR